MYSHTRNLQLVRGIQCTTTVRQVHSHRQLVVLLHLLHDTLPAGFAVGLRHRARCNRIATQATGRPAVWLNLDFSSDVDSPRSRDSAASLRNAGRWCLQYWLVAARCNGVPSCRNLAIAAAILQRLGPWRWLLRRAHNVIQLGPHKAQVLSLSLDRGCSHNTSPGAQVHLV